MQKLSASSCCVLSISGCSSTSRSR
jgi:hypothetical protein